VLSENEEHFKSRQIEFVLCLFQILMRPLWTHTADNYQWDNSRNIIKVKIDEEKNIMNFISVWNASLSRFIMNIRYMCPTHIWLFVITQPLIHKPKKPLTLKPSQFWFYLSTIK
jgi:hypothetical protein